MNSQSYKIQAQFIHLEEEKVHFSLTSNWILVFSFNIGNKLYNSSSMCGTFHHLGNHIQYYHIAVIGICVTLLVLLELLNKEPHILCSPN